MKLRDSHLELTGPDIGVVIGTGLLGVAPYSMSPSTWASTSRARAGRRRAKTPRLRHDLLGDRRWAAIEEAVARGAHLVAAARDVGEDIVIGAVEDPFGNVLGFIENRHFAACGRGVGLDLRADPIVITRDVTADPATCFGAWASSEGMAAWWAETRIELRVGGHYELYMLPGPLRRARL